MTDDPVVLLREAAQQATPGPWQLDGPWWHGSEAVDMVTAGERRVAVSIAPPSSFGTGRADAEFIVAARNHLDAVLAEVVRLRAQVEDIRNIVRPHHYQYLPAAYDGYCCGECNRQTGGYVDWPCPTVRALGGPDD